MFFLWWYLKKKILVLTEIFFSFLANSQHNFHKMGRRINKSSLSIYTRITDEMKIENFYPNLILSSNWGFPYCIREKAKILTLVTSYIYQKKDQDQRNDETVTSSGESKSSLLCWMLSNIYEKNIKSICLCWLLNNESTVTSLIFGPQALLLVLQVIFDTLMHKSHISKPEVSKI